MGTHFDKERAIEFCILALKRALWTFAEVALFMIGYGMVSVSSIDWKAVIDVAVGTAIVSVLKSIVAGMPEYAKDGSVMIDDNTCVVNLGIGEDEVKAKKSIRLDVVSDKEDEANK